MPFFLQNLRKLSQNSLSAAVMISTLKVEKLTNKVEIYILFEFLKW